MDRLRLILPGLSRSLSRPADAGERRASILTSGQARTRVHSPAVTP